MLGLLITNFHFSLQQNAQKGFENFEPQWEYWENLD